MQLPSRQDAQPPVPLRFVETHRGGYRQTEADDGDDASEADDVAARQFAGLTRLQLDEVGRERQVQRQGRQRAEALAEGSVELAQAMVPLASALARGGGCRVSVLVSVCSAVTAGWCARLLILGIVLRSGGVCVRVNLRFFWGAFVSCCFACGCVLELVVCRVRFARVCLAPVRG